ncbi:MAG: DUF3060 domain-containing protein [Proteobacteria bacterium]|nr:DUF3060 domain-containing protein [Pseudomonadota bacterium]
MHRFPWIFAVLSLAGVTAGCVAPAELKPTFENGWTVYAESYIRKPIDCQGGKVQLNGDRLDTHLTNECQGVRVTGTHNDVEVDIAPGGGIEITGSHNDVFWHQARPGPRPRLIDSGVSNTFHPAQ